MSQTEAKWASKRAAMIALYGEERCILAYRLNRVDGEGETVMHEHTKIPRRHLHGAFLVGEELVTQVIGQ